MRPDIVTYEDAIQSADPMLRLSAHALRAATATTTADVAAIIGVSRRRTLHSAVALTACTLAGAEEWILMSTRTEDPFDPRRMTNSGATVLAVDDLGDDGVDYRRHLASLGLCDRITMYLRSAGAVVAAIALGRSLEHERFTSFEALRLRRAHPLIESAYRCGVEPRARAMRLIADSGLSSREMNVAALVARGATNAEIARSLQVSVTTVKAHLRRIYVKMSVQSRTQLALRVDGAATHWTEHQEGGVRGPSASTPARTGPSL